MRILVASSLDPFKFGNGGQLQVWNLISELSRLHDVRTVALGNASDLDGTSVVLIPPIHFSTPRRLLATVGGWFGRDPFLVRQLRATALEDAVAREAVRFQPDCVIITNGPAAYLAGVLGTVPKVLSTIDSWSFNEFQIFASGSRVKRLYGRAVVHSVRRFDKGVLRDFDAIVTVSDNDRQWMRELCPAANIEVISNGVDTEFFSAGTGAPEPNPERSIVFHGTMDYPPNVLAAQFAVESVMPLVWAKAPDVRLHLVGRSPSDAVTRLAGDRVVVTGAVDDIRPWLRGAAMSVFPILTGSGVKNKLLEAASMARPIVATPSAIGDVAFTHGVHAWIGDDERALADGILTLLERPDEGRVLGSAARAQVVAEHSWQSVGRQYARVCSEAVAQSGRTEVADTTQKDR